MITDGGGDAWQAGRMSSATGSGASPVRPPAGWGWWDVASVGVPLVTALATWGVTLTGGWPGPERGLASAAVMLVAPLAWLTFGRAVVAEEADGRFWTPRSLAYQAVLVVVLGVATGLAPNAAILQCLAYPTVWFFAAGVRGAVVGSAVVASSMAVGHAAGQGWAPDAVGSAVVIALLSFGLSMGLGLWITRIAAYGEERARLLDELTAAQDRLAHANRDAGMLEERERIARDIHDTIAQSLTGIVLLAQRAGTELRAGGDDAPAATPAAATVAAIEENARDALAEARGLVAAVSPASLDDGGVVAAVRRFAARFERETGIPVAVTDDVRDPVARDTEVVLLRCVQEALANVRKHAGASRTTVHLVSADGAASVRIEDDGCGFDVGAPHDGFGLEGMRRRLGVDGGRLDVTSGPGTCLTATVPTR